MAHDDVMMMSLYLICSNHMQKYLVMNPQMVIFGIKPPPPILHTHTHTHSYTHAHTCRTLLPKVQPQMFEQWVHMFGCEVIMQSSRLPLVSGFYKLLATCLKICKTVDYFKVLCILLSPNRVGF